MSSTTSISYNLSTWHQNLHHLSVNSLPSIHICKRFTISQNSISSENQFHKQDPITSFFSILFSHYSSQYCPPTTCNDTAITSSTHQPTANLFCNINSYHYIHTTILNCNILTTATQHHHHRTFSLLLYILSSNEQLKPWIEQSQALIVHCTQSLSNPNFH